MVGAALAAALFVVASVAAAATAVGASADASAFAWLPLRMWAAQSLCHNPALFFQSQGLVNCVAQGIGASQNVWSRLTEDIASTRLRHYARAKGKKYAT